MEKKENSNIYSEIFSKLNYTKERIAPLLPELLIIIGIIFVLYSTSHRYFRNRSLLVNKNIVSQYSQENGQSQDTPTHIIIPQLVDTKISEELYDNGSWTISEDTASYLSQSARPGEDGNIIIYGHNKKEIMGNILSLNGNEIITLVTKGGAEHHYQVTEIVEVDPTNVQHLQPTETEILTIYTCSGFMDSKRFIVQAVPIEMDLDTSLDLQL